ncbi:MAG: LysR family transcriptional regulator [Pseudomonadota bacterium]
MSSPVDRLTLMSTYVRITERGSISAAAADLGMTQATASRQLSALESRLGAQLIERTTHSLTVTETGKEVLADARALLSRWERLKERLSADREALAGPVKLVVPIALGRAFLCDAVLAFGRSHPEVSINIVLDDQPGPASEAGYDLLVKVGRPDDESLIVQEIIQIERMPVASPTLVGEGVTPVEDLQGLPFASLGPFEGAVIPLHHANGGRKTIHPTPVWATNDIFALRDAVIAGQGWGILPTWLVATELNDEKLVRLAPEWAGPALPVTIGFQPSRRSIRRVRALADAISLSLRDIVEATRPKELT